MTLLKFFCFFSVKGLCQNQRFVKRQYKQTQWHKFHRAAGFGLMAKENIHKGEFVIEYVGDLIDENECSQRIEQMYKDNIDDFYFLSLDQSRCVTTSSSLFL